MSNPSRPGQTLVGDEHEIPMYAWSVAMGSVKKMVSTSCIPRRSISAFLARTSFVRSARQAAKAVPSCNIAHAAPKRLTTTLKSYLLNPKTFWSLPTLPFAGFLGMG